MSQGTHIQWAEASWNPIVGCTRVSAGCAHCYAIREIHRMAGNPNHKIAQVSAGLTTRHKNGQLDWTGVVRLLHDRLEQPLHWKKPRRIFVNSLSDFFHENVPAAFIDQMLEVMAACPQHIFQVLTKRPENMHRKLYEITSEHPVRFFGGGDYLPNVWWGVSAEDQEMADTRIPPLLSIPAAVHWVSAEPLLDELDLRPYLQQLEWVVVGGESAPRGYARWCDPTWIWQIIHQCRVARVAVFVKQLGNYIAGCRNYQHPKGGAIEEWPRGLQVREYPQR